MGGPRIRKPSGLKVATPATLFAGQRHGEKFWVKFHFHTDQGDGKPI